MPTGILWGLKEANKYSLRSKRRQQVRIGVNGAKKGLNDANSDKHHFSNLELKYYGIWFQSHWCWEVDFQLTKVANAATMLAVNFTHIPIILAQLGKKVTRETLKNAIFVFPALTLLWYHWVRRPFPPLLLHFDEIFL